MGIRLSQLSTKLKLKLKLSLAKALSKGSQFYYPIQLGQAPKPFLKSGKLFHIYGDRVPHLLEEVGDMVRGHVLVQGSFRLPGFNDGERVSTQFLEKPSRDAASTFLEKMKKVSVNQEVYRHSYVCWLFVTFDRHGGE